MASLTSLVRPIALTIGGVACHKALLVQRAPAGSSLVLSVFISPTAKNILLFFAAVVKKQQLKKLHWQGGLVRAALLDLCQVPAAAKSEAAAQPTNCSWRCLKIVTYMYMYQQVKVQVSDTCRGTWLSQVSFEWCSRDETRTYSRGACETRTYRLRYPDRYALEGSLQSDLQLHA